MEYDRHAIKVSDGWMCLPTVALAPPPFSPGKQESAANSRSNPTFVNTAPGSGRQIRSSHIGALQVVVLNCCLGLDSPQLISFFFGSDQDELA